ncbi:TlpA family protein disulfide reductase [Polaribacter sp. Hel1_85]|uniref:TlpA family protein disulfide reductase n=1 Tax=Polaribacter sp. Hel1_85 TaxID=1250005 RepID=UPI00052D9DBC|nr:hypothetical protein [Polaribacter sp. Hel1_85]KGL63186.1 conserved hypothetical protein, thioredoxin-like fold protein [Polaribacter sp. Hel1_85]
MFKYLLHLTFLFAITALVSCDSNPKSTATYFGGKIINPKSNYVILYSMEKVIDTLFLGKDNKFLGKLDNANEGLYYFKHGNENQYIYLEPLDSLMLRLNTWDFDESIVFAGKGAERNNILIDCFLEEEKDNKMFYKLNHFEPDEFHAKADSLLLIKEKTYSDYIANHPEETSGFKNVLKIALTYPIFARIERYPIAHVKYSKKTDFHDFKNSFYTHRQSVSINNDSLMYYPPFSQYVRNFLYNTTYSLGHKPMTDEYSSDFTVDLLKTIDKNIKSKESKNAFLKQTVIGHFYRKSSCDANKDAFNAYFDLSTSTKDKDRVRQLLLDSKALHKNQKITDFAIHDLNNGIHSIKHLIKNKNTFIFFWNPEYVSTMYISSRLNYLSQKFPEIQFIPVKIDGNKNDRIHKLDIKNQFFITAKSEANNFLTSKMPRSIIINKKGIVTNGFASISSKKLYPELKTLSKH